MRAARNWDLKATRTVYVSRRFGHRLASKFRRVWKTTRDFHGNLISLQPIRLPFQLELEITRWSKPAKQPKARAEESVARAFQFDTASGGGEGYGDATSSELRCWWSA